jgi:protein-tyrosine-phosphatase
VTRVLFVCTANQARSAFAEAVFKSLNTDIEVASAGTQATAGNRCDTNSLAVAKQLGLDLSAHRSSRLNTTNVQGNDLVVCMTNEHLRHTVGLFTKSWPLTFTLTDFVRRASKVGPRAGGDMTRYIAHIHEGRSLKDAWIDGSDADVPDPVERSVAGHQKIFQEIRELTRTMELLLR